MLASPLAILLSTIIMAIPAFSANATEWSTRSVYQVARRRPQIRTRLRLTAGFRLSQTGLRS